MEREIKFRYWDSFNGEMVTRDWTSKFFELYEMACSGDNKPILMQYTGLTDKNGKEIYEGDIIKCEIYEREDYDDFNSQKPIVVKWSDRATGFWPLNKASGWRSGCANIEVLGNLYEHPHLMKQEIK